jgi:hypothetical protein
MASVPAIDLSSVGQVSIDDYGGESDLDGELWVTHDDEQLYLTATIQDETHYQEEVGQNIWRGDSIQFGIAPLRGDTFDEVNIALTPEGPQVYRTSQPVQTQSGYLEAATVDVVRDEAAETTTYEVAIPWDALRASPEHDAFRTAIIVNDNDGEGREGYIWWGADIGSSKNVDPFVTGQLVDASTGERPADGPVNTATPDDGATVATPTPSPAEMDETATTTPDDSDGATRETPTTTPATGPGLGILAAILGLLVALGAARRHGR